MKFKAKVFKLGNSKAVYLPKDVYTDLEENREYEFEVYTDDEKVYTNRIEAEKPTAKVYTGKRKSKKLLWCKKHQSYNTTCKCEQ